MVGVVIDMHQGPTLDMEMMVVLIALQQVQQSALWGPGAEVFEWG